MGRSWLNVSSYMWFPTSGGSVASSEFSIIELLALHTKAGNVVARHARSRTCIHFTVETRVSASHGWLASAQADYQWLVGSCDGDETDHRYQLCTTD